MLKCYSVGYSVTAKVTSCWGISVRNKCRKSSVWSVRLHRTKIHIFSFINHLIRSHNNLVVIGEKTNQCLPENFVILFGVFLLLSHTHRSRNTVPASHWPYRKKGRSDWWNLEYRRRNKKSRERWSSLFFPRVFHTCIDCIWQFAYVCNQHYPITLSQILIVNKRA